jgi:hypothetical protein
LRSMFQSITAVQRLTGAVDAKTCCCVYPVVITLILDKNERSEGSVCPPWMS